MKTIILTEEISNEKYIELTGKENEIINKNMTFPSEEDAIEYLSDMVSENKTFRVKFLGSTDIFEESEKYLELNNKLEKLIIEKLEFPLNIINRFNEQKSSSKGCSNCKSSINKEIHGNKLLNKYEEINFNENIQNILDNEILNTEITSKLLEKRFSLLNCPICDSSDFILNETDNEKFNKINERIEENINKINEEKEKFYQKAEKKTLYMIGYID